MRLFIRHGEVGYFGAKGNQGKSKNPRDIDLAENGIKQARAAALNVNKKEPSPIVVKGNAHKKYMLLSNMEQV